MEIKFKEEGHTLGCLIREHLDHECDEDFSACTVAHPKDDFLTVCAPDKASIRRALLSARQDLNTLRVFLNNNADKRKRTRGSKSSG